MICSLRLVNSLQQQKEEFIVTTNSKLQSKNYSYVKKERPYAVLLLQWSSQSSGLNPTEMLRRDLKSAAHKQMPPNFNELKQYCKEEWAKTPPQQCERPIESYRKWLHQVILLKVVLQATDLWGALSFHSAAQNPAKTFFFAWMYIETGGKWVTVTQEAQIYTGSNQNGQD